MNCDRSTTEGTLMPSLQMQEIHRSSFKSFLSTILDSSLIQDLITIIYSYARRYDDPTYSHSREHFRNWDDYKYAASPYNYYDHIHDLVYRGDMYHISITDKSEYVYNNITNVFRNPIDVLNNKICIVDKCKIKIINKESLRTLHIYDLKHAINNCIFVSDNTILTMHHKVLLNIITLFDITHELKQLKFIRTNNVLGIGANHENIFILRYSKDKYWHNTYVIRLMIHNHELEFIKEVILNTHSTNILRFRIYDDKMYITTLYLTKIYEMNDL
jgi:hypothetical protein